MKSGIKIFVAMVFTAVVIAAGVFAYYTLQMKPKIKAEHEQLVALQSVMNSNLRTVYVTSRDLVAGEVFSVDCVYEETQYISDVSSLCSAADFGKVLITDVAAGQTVSSYLLTEFVPTNGERVVQYSCFRLSPRMADGLYVDVRIRYQNGEDYVVLSKKQLQGVDLSSSTCFLSVDDIEMQMMASAICDANQYDASLYTTLYTNPDISEAAYVDYVPNFNNPTLFGRLYTAKNVELRTALLERLAYLAEGEKDLSNLSGTLGGDVDNTSAVGTD